MIKKTIIFISTCTLLMSCEQSSETFEAKEEPAVTEQLEITKSNENVKTAQEVPTKSAMEKISPDVLATLDILTDYDREFWSGPDQWNEELWAWKILLKWDQECDFEPVVREHSLHLSEYTFIAVQCSLGAYQPSFNTYLLDKKTKEYVQLKLGRTLDSPELRNRVLGDIALDTNTNELSILTVAVGTKDCGTYRKLNFVQGDNVKTSYFELQSIRKQECFTNPADIESLPYSATDYKNWPIVDE